MTKALNRRVINVQILIEVSIYDYHSDIIERMFYGAPNGLRIVGMPCSDTHVCSHTHARDRLNGGRNYVD